MADDLAAERLSHLLAGYEVEGNKDAAAALEVISAAFAKMFRGRRPSKPLDLLHFIGKDSHVSPALIAELTDAGLESVTVDSVTEALETLHRRAVPKLGIGTLMLHKKIAGKAPLKVAYDHGCRLFPLMDPIPMMKEVNNVEEQGNDLRDCDLSVDAVVMGAANCFAAPSTTAEQARGYVRRSFDAMAAALGPLHVGDGQPLLDIYEVNPPHPALT